MAQQPRRLVPTELAAMAAGVSDATIRKWASRGKLTRYGCRSRAKYDLNEIFVLVSRNADSASLTRTIAGQG